MKYRKSILSAGLLVGATFVSAETQTATDRNETNAASPQFKFKTVPSPLRNDAAASAKVSLIEGEKDRNGGGLEKLNDGKLPSADDQPGENFFFDAGTPGGRFVIDLGKAIDVSQINTYSWHPGARGPQVYHVHGSDGTSSGFVERPKREDDLEKSGWQLIGRVDTRPKNGEGGGQFGVSLSNPAGSVGKYRYLLFDILRTEDADAFGNSFYSEIDVIDHAAPPEAQPASTPAATGAKDVIEADGGKYRITIDTTETPDLTEWTRTQLAPVMKEWYPKIVAMLPSEGFEAPQECTINFRKDMRGVAATGGTRIGCAADWFRRNLDGEAKGAVVHELVHVVQQYGRARRTNPDATRPPGWLVEGIPDYIRWFLYEPESRGAEIRSAARARYDGSYRVSANFLNWVVGKHDKEIIVKLNAALREGRYREELWKELTGHTVQELGAEWKEAIESKLAASSPGSASPNVLSEAERAAGWKLLFDGKSLDGWHNFKRPDVRPGWQVKDGSLACVDPHHAGDLVTAEQFGAFELQLEYNISEGGNSGIIYHASDEGGAVWASGPEFQLEDNAKASDPERCGWLYGLYKPDVDPKTGKPVDATKPAGQWNHVRLVVSAEKCTHEINGVKYFEYVLGSDDFNRRVAESKFAQMPLFAKARSGRLALQGDHGQVSFRNLKVLPLKAAP